MKKNYKHCYDTEANAFNQWQYCYPEKLYEYENYKYPNMEKKYNSEEEWLDGLSPNILEAYNEYTIDRGNKEDY